MRSTINHQMRVSLFATAALALVALFIAPRAQAVTCGDEINNDLVLTADLGPCQGQWALLINNNTSGTTLKVDLNGHRIIGNGSNVGLRVSANRPVTLKGPGRVMNFSVGISFSHVAHGSSVYDLTLVNNVWGIGTVQQGGLRVFDNVIRGGQTGQIGIYMGEVGTSYFYRNTITGHALAGVSIQDSAANTVISQNTISRNQIGILTSRDTADVVIRGNKISQNVTNGVEIRIGNSYVIEDNELDGNGQSGIVLAQFAHGTWNIQNNVVQNHPVYGIDVVTASSAANIAIAGNRLSGNGTDFHWDTFGNACWFVNVFNTSDPVMLPMCP